MLRDAFALRHDRGECSERGLQADDFRRTGQKRLGGSELQRRIAAERDLLSAFADETADAVAENVVELADGVVIHRHRREARTVGAAHERALRRERRAIGFVQVGRAFQMDEVLQGLGIERRELDDDAGRQVAQVEREIRATQARRAAERGADVPHGDQMTHLLARDLEDDAAPSRDCLELCGIQSLVRTGLQ